MYSKHPKNDTTVYDDDIVVHASDYAPDGTDNAGYHRPFNSLVDDTTMEGNCADAQAGWGENEMYPCINNDLTYGTAITGINDKNVKTISVNLVINSISEPDIREDVDPSAFTGTLEFANLDEAKTYAVYRFDSIDSFVSSNGDYENSKYFSKNILEDFEVSADGSFVYEDVDTFMSNEATIYRVVEVKE